MKELVQSIAQIHLIKEHRKEQLSKCSASEPNNFFNLTGKLNWLGHGMLPQAAFAESQLKRCINNLTFYHIVTAKKLLLEIKSLILKTIMLHRSHQADSCYLAFSGAS